MNETGFWDSAYRDNAPALLGVMRRYVKEASIAQDLLHEVFITAINKYDTYTGKGCFEGWLHRIAVNTALMYLRNEKNKQVPAEAVLTVACDDDADDGQADDARTAIEAAGFSDEELLSAIDRLPGHHKLVFNMYVMDDFSHKQIGAELNISPGTSKSHLARARKKIQQFLYDDALKKKLKDRRRASAFLLLFPAKTHFIDKLYRQGLSDFSLPPTGGTEFLSAALEQHAASTAASAVSQAVTSTASTVSQTAATTAMQSSATVVTQVVATATFWGSKLSYIAMCCGTAAVTGSVCWVSMSENSPLNQQEGMILPVADTLMYASKPVAIDSTSTYDATGSLTPDPSPKKRGDALPTDNADPVQGNDNVQSSNLGNSVQTGTDRTSKTDGTATSQAKPHSISSPGKGPRSGTDKTDNTPTTGEKEPVVIKKQIIQHQTVVVRDTIIITE